MTSANRVDTEGMTTRKERAEAAATLRRVLAAVERGELDVNSAHAKRLLRQIEGATAALEALDAKPGEKPGEEHG